MDNSYIRVINIFFIPTDKWFSHVNCRNASGVCHRPVREEEGVMELFLDQGSHLFVRPGEMGLSVSLETC